MPTIEIEIPALHQGQQVVMDGAARFNVLECGRRFGKTTLGEHLAVDEAVAGAPVGWFAPNYSYLLDAWNNISRITRPITTSANKMDKRIDLMTGGAVDFWTIDNPDAGRGRKYKRAIIDEGGIARNLKEAWEGAIRPTLTDLRGDAWFLGTPKGHGYFHQLYSRGEQKAKDWASWRLPTVSNPFISAEEIEDARRDLPPTVFDQEYLGIPAPDGGNPFDQTAIAECTAEMSSDAPVVFGIDLAKSHDWCVVCGLDAQGRVCVLERWQGDWGHTRSRILSMVGEVPTLVDSTGVGDPIVEDMQRVKPNINGFKFSSTSKQQLMEGLAAEIHQRNLRFPAGWLVNELESFTYEYHRGGRVQYTAPQGLHDDGVCALALAAQHLKSAQRNIVDARWMGGFKVDINNWTGDDTEDEAGWTRL